MSQGDYTNYDAESEIRRMWAEALVETCRVCPNHPENGGSGVCFCTLGGLGSVSVGKVAHAPILSDPDDTGM